MREPHPASGLLAALLAAAALTGPASAGRQPAPPTLARAAVDDTSASGAPAGVVARPVPPTRRPGGPSHGVLELAATVFLPDLAIDDVVLVQNVPVRWFTSRKDRYTGWHVALAGGNRIGYRASLGLGKRTFYLFAEGPAISVDALDLEAIWFYLAAGPAWHVRRGPLAASPSLGLGGALIAASMTAAWAAGSDEANGLTTFLSYEAPLRIWIGPRVGLAAAYQGFVTLSDPSFGFSKGAVRLDGRSRHGYELRFGVCTR